MIKLENLETNGWEASIRGCRNPYNSWDKSDSKKSFSEIEYNAKFIVGDNDLKLMQKLSKAGSDHAKFLRMINVTVDITAPLYWWKEYDTYKVGTVANSCSTMHKIHDKEFTIEDFSCEHLGDMGKDTLLCVIKAMNTARELFVTSKQKWYWYQMIQLLPTSYNQKRTVQLNYQVLKNIYHARKNHKLDEWREFCKWIEVLPYARELICNV